MTLKSFTVALNYSRLEDIPSDILEDDYCQNYLSKLYLKQNLIVNLTPLIKKLHALTELYLHSNHIECLPDEIGDLSSLTHLSLDSNHLSSLNPSVGNMANLESLSVCNNDLTALPDELWTCGSLVSVYASTNMISHLSPAIIRCQTLQCLNLDRNNLGHLPIQLACIPSLRGLSFSGNCLESLPSDICRLSNLTSLLVDGHPKLMAIPASFTLLPFLKKLGIEGCCSHLERHRGDQVLPARRSSPHWEASPSPVHSVSPAPLASLQELSARVAHCSLRVQPGFPAAAVYLREELQRLLQIPLFLCDWLIPSSHCAVCGVPIAREPLREHLSTAQSNPTANNQQPEGHLNNGDVHMAAADDAVVVVVRGNEAKIVESWWTKSATGRRTLCPCDSHVTLQQPRRLGVQWQGLAGPQSNGVLAAVGAKHMRLSFDFCSVNCRNYTYMCD